MSSYSKCAAYIQWRSLHSAVCVSACSTQAFVLGTHLLTGAQQFHYGVLFRVNCFMSYPQHLVRFFAASVCIFFCLENIHSYCQSVSSTSIKKLLNLNINLIFLRGGVSGASTRTGRSGQPTSSSNITLPNTTYAWPL